MCFFNGTGQSEPVSGRPGLGIYERDGSLWINHNDTGTAALVASVGTPKGPGHLAFAAAAWAGHLNRLAGLLAIALIRIGITAPAVAPPPRTATTATGGHLLLIATTLRRARYLHRSGFNHLDCLSCTGYYLSGSADSTVNRTGVRHWRKRQSNSCYYCVYFHSIFRLGKIHGFWETGSGLPIQRKHGGHRRLSRPLANPSLRHHQHLQKTARAPPPV